LVIVALYSLRFKSSLNRPVSADSPLKTGESGFAHPESPEAEAQHGWPVSRTLTGGAAGSVKVHDRMDPGWDGPGDGQRHCDTIRLEGNGERLIMPGTI